MLHYVSSATMQVANLVKYTRDNMRQYIQVIFTGNAISPRAELNGEELGRHFNDTMRQYIQVICTEKAISCYTTYPVLPCKLQT